MFIICEGGIAGFTCFDVPDADITDDEKKLILSCAPYVEETQNPDRGYSENQWILARWLHAPKKEGAGPHGLKSQSGRWGSFKAEPGPLRSKEWVIVHVP